MTEKQYLIWKKTMRVCRRIFRCHQLSDRSLHIKGVQLPLCARCTGLVLGFLLLGPIISLLTEGNIFLSVGLILMMCADGLIQWVGIRPSTNVRRIVTGLAAGYACFSLLMQMVRDIITWIY